ncbi:MAG: galactofuranose ABC transporter, permease protein YjfF [Armatimonadota bacterium]
MISTILRKHASLLATIAIGIALYTTASILYPGFSSPQVFVNLFVDNSFLGIIAIGMTIVILSGGIDLSVGAVMALCSTVMAVLMTVHHVNPFLTLVISLSLGTGLGFLMGLIIGRYKLAPFIVTLAGMFLARGLAYIVNMGAVSIQNPLYTGLTEASVNIGDIRITLPAFVFLGVVVCGVFIAGHTQFGRSVYAIGGNEESAGVMGLPVTRTKILVYTLSGFCSAIAGVVFTIYQSAGNPSAGMGLEMDAIATVVIGGTLLTGGSGNIIGTLVGTLILGIIQTGITFQGTLNSWWTKVTVGMLILIFIILQRILGRRKKSGS